MTTGKAHYERAIAAHRVGNFAEAERHIRAAIDESPGQPTFPYFLGIVLHDQKRLAEAEFHLNCAIKLRGGFSQAWSNLALVYQDQGKTDDAISAFTTAIRHEPSNFHAHNNLGLLLGELGRTVEAAEHFKTAIDLKPAFFEAHYNLGKLASRLGDESSAIGALRAAVMLSPRHTNALHRLGLALARTDHIEEAIEVLERAWNTRPGSLKLALAACLSLPLIYDSRGQIERSRSRFERGLEKLIAASAAFLAPDRRKPLVDLEWSNFLLAYQGHDDRRTQAKYGEFAKTLIEASAPELLNWTPPDKAGRGSRKIRVGYLSRFFWDCTVGHYFKGWITQADRDRFEIYVYALPCRHDTVTEEIEAASDRFQVMAGDTHSIVSAIRADQLDFLVFPELGMDGTTLLLASCRSAPIQCCGWGHPVTSGLPNVDYFLTPGPMEPPQAASHYSEALVMLGGIGTHYTPPRLPGRAERDLFGLPEGRNLYLFPQSLFKIHPDNDELLARVLAGDPRGHLVLFETRHPDILSHFLQRLRGVLSRHGIDRPDERIKVLPYLPRDDYLRVNLLCDVMLDCLHWSGGNTSLDALACGLPVVTLPGEFMRGRQTAGMLKLAGLDDLIARDTAHYVELAVALGTDPDRREATRARLRLAVHALFEQTEPIRNLERFYLSRSSRNSEDEQTK